MSVNIPLLPFVPKRTSLNKKKNMVVVHLLKLGFYNWIFDSIKLGLDGVVERTLAPKQCLPFCWVCVCLLLRFLRSMVASLVVRSIFACSSI